jgi:formate dehydrogenase maturation protein FdhE
MPKLRRKTDMNNSLEEKGYCPMCGIIPAIEIGGLIYGERVRYFKCNNCGAEFGIFSLNDEIKKKIIQSNYGDLYKHV